MQQPRHACASVGVTPSLDLHAALNFAEDDKNRTLTISGSVTGDTFPSSEAFVVDQSGKGKVFLGAKKEEGGILDLFGDNNEPLYNVNITINFDKNGNFISVTQGNKTYTVAEWNKYVKDNFK
ncbi:MAG TPA: hypothetical protein VHE59_14225 [Mucilaginibacter sp.]|nr:hypothetical protein [Mucilaginibacter sp.]